MAYLGYSDGSAVKRVLTILSEDSVRFPAHTHGSLQPPVTPILRNPIGSSGLHRHKAHTCMPAKYSYT